MNRTIFVGDVHGCLAELEDLLARLGPAPGDRLVFVGDLVDRGPDSVGVVRRVRRLLDALPGSAVVCGNHEEKALRYRAKGKAIEPWAEAARDDDWAFLAGLPLVHRADEVGAVVVHGGFYPAFFERYGELGDIPPDWRTARGKLGDRLRRFLRVRRVDHRGHMLALDRQTAADRHWAETYDGRAGFCFFGHDPQLAPPEVLRAEHAMGLDTGCCFGGRLTAAVLDADHPPAAPKLVQVDARAQYAEPRRDV